EAACALLGPGNEYIRNLEDSASIKLWLRADSGFHQQADSIEVITQADPGSMSLNGPQIDDTISIPVQTALYPPKDPQFIVHDHRLILVENLRKVQQQLQASTTKYFEVKITATGRW